jgi:hypothetical protein
VGSLSGGMGKTGNVRSGSRARRSRRELHGRFVTVDRSFSRRTSSEAYKCTESRTICRLDPQEELFPGVRDKLIGDPDCSKVNPLPRESVMFMSSGSDIPLGSCRWHGLITLSSVNGMVFP